MRLRDILAYKGGEVWCVEADQTLAQAIALMNERRVGALVVRSSGGVSSGSVRGIVTERDLLRTCHQQAHRGRPGEWASMLVKDVMTEDLVIGRADDSIDDAAAVMTERRVRHLPVFDGDVLAGLVSIGDIVKAQHQKADVEVRMLKRYVEGSYPG
ncbi:MAG: CBS domain-containing protein [Planctomycetota bacterium]